MRKGNLRFLPILSWYQELSFFLPPLKLFFAPQGSHYLYSFCRSSSSFVFPMSSLKINPTTLVTNIKICYQFNLMMKALSLIRGALYSNSIVAHLVEDHIIPGDDSKTSSSTDPEWKCLDDIVWTWLYATISIDLLKNFVHPHDNAKDA